MIRHITLVGLRQALPSVTIAEEMQTTAAIEPIKMGGCELAHRNIQNNSMQGKLYAPTR
jgi:hypothetical protein